MKTYLISLLGLIGFTATVKAGEKIMPYSAFGPQVVAYELIGKEWWQWQDIGGDDDGQYLIKVVVYWDQTLEETAKRYPVNESKQQDYRYVSYLEAVKHMRRLIQDWKADNIDTSVIEMHLAELTRSYQNEQTASSNH